MVEKGILQGAVTPAVRPSAGRDWFDEKGRQVEPASIRAFGIELVSRYGKARELREMLAFAELVAVERAERYVSQVFYDSKANLCTFELAAGVRQFDPVGRVLLSVASETIEQFEMFDVFGGLMHSHDQD